MTERGSVPLTIATTQGEVHALLDMPPSARWLYVFAHGAGAGMRHTFMEAASAALNDRGIATLRYEYPYIGAGTRRPDRAPALEQYTRDMVAHAAAGWPALRIAAGGKSMGGRMTSRAQSAGALARTEALIFFGFPLHPPKKRGVERAEHLRLITIPLLFLQGTRDDLADIELLRTVVSELGSVARLHVVDGADHAFAVLKRSGRTGDDVLAELADTTVAFLASID